MYNVCIGEGEIKQKTKKEARAMEQKQKMEQNEQKNVIKKIYGIKEDIKKLLRYYMFDLSYFKLFIEPPQENKKFILRIIVWIGPRKGLQYIIKDLLRLLRENNLNEIGKIIFEYELLKRKKQNIKKSNFESR